jgi:hypothetical protein
VCIHLHGAQLLLEVIVTINKRKFFFVGHDRRIASIEQAAQGIALTRATPVTPLSLFSG